jgi:hypothetical protein
MKRIWNKRKFIIIVVTVFVLGLFGELMQNPPNMVDAITGATSKMKKKQTEKAEFANEYIFGINPNGDMDVELLEELYQAICQWADLKSFSKDVNIQITISKDDAALEKYMRSFETAMEKEGLSINVISYSSLMAASRVHSGKYDVFLLDREAVLEQDLENCSYFVIKGSEMR